jgi:DNA-binding LacI/PurR family transcriptional regulator
MDAGQMSCLVAMAATPACLLADAAKRHVPAYRNATENNTLQVPCYLDYKQFSSMALEEIHRQGGRRVAMLAWWETGGSVDRRHFLSSAQALGLQTSDSWIIGDLDPKETSSGWAAFREFWTSSSEHPDSLIIADEALLPGALQAMTDLGLKPQQDIRIVSHGNSPDLLPIVSRDVTRIWYALEDFVSANLRAINALLAGAPLASPLQIKPTLETLHSPAKTPAGVAHKPSIKVKR